MSNGEGIIVLLFSVGEYYTYMEVLQMATYWFVICWFGNQKTQKSEVRQATKDVVKSEVHPQTYILKYMIVVVCAPGQPTTWSLSIVLYIGVLLFLK